MKKKTPAEKKLLKSKLKEKKKELSRAKKDHKKRVTKHEAEKAKEIEKHRKKISGKKDTKLKNHEKILHKKTRQIEKKSQQLEKEKQKKLEELARKKEELEKDFHKKKARLESDVVKLIEEKTEQLDKLTAKKRKESEKDIEDLKKEIISTEKKLYTGRQKLSNAVYFAVCLYVFLLAVTLIKEGIVQLGMPLLGSISVFMDSAVSAFGAGWLGAYVFHSGSVLAVTANALVGVGAFTLHILFFALAGSLLGNVSTPVFVAMFSGSKTRHGLRHGFELVVANSVFAFFLVLLVVAVELLTGLFSTFAGWIESHLSAGAAAAFPDLLDIIIGPLKDLLIDAVSLIGFLGDFQPVLVFLIGVALFIASLKFLTRAVLKLLGGRARARSIINRYFGSPWMAFLIGILITLMIASMNMSLSLLVPLAVIGIIDLKKAIPYIMGINTGTGIDVIIAGAASGLSGTFAGAIMFIMICSFSVFLMLHPIFREGIYRITRIFTGFMSINRKSIIVFLLLYGLVPLLMVLSRGVL